MRRFGGVGRRALFIAGALVFAWSLGYVGDAAYGNCQTMPSDPMCSGGGMTSPPQTSPPVQHTSPSSDDDDDGGGGTHTTSKSVTNSNSNTPAVQQPSQPRTVTRTPAPNRPSPSRQPRFQPNVPDPPAPPAEDFAASTGDPAPQPAVDLGAVAIPDPTPAAAPPPPPPPSSKSGPGALPLAAGGGLGVLAGVALAGRKPTGDDPAIGQAKVGAAKVLGGLGVLVATGVIDASAGALAVGTATVAVPIGFAIGFALFAVGAIDILTMPKVQPTGAVAHAGSTRG